LVRIRPERTSLIVLALGSAQTLSWASTYYIPAVLAEPMARDIGVPTVAVFAAFSGALVVAALVGPWAGRRIDLFGGRGLLMVSNLIFAAALLILAAAQGPAAMVAGWLLLGVGMGIGLYEAAFAALAVIYRRSARSPITGITLLAGFASTIGWPLSAWMEARFGWRFACCGWAAAQLLLALPLNALLPSGLSAKPETPAGQEPAPEPAKASPLALVLLAYVFAVTLFVSTALASHLPRVLEAAGATAAAAIFAGTLIGPAQVAARVAEFGLLRGVHPLVSARLAALGHPLAAAGLLIIGAPASAGFALLHGAGNGVMTIAKGTLPLALFGPGGYGLRQGLLAAPARIAQAAAPLAFGLALERWGAGALWLTGGLTLSAFLALLALRR
jgi:MFS family permease